MALDDLTSRSSFFSVTFYDLELTVASIAILATK